MSAASIKDLNPKFICDPNVDLTGEELTNADTLYIFIIPNREKLFV